MRYLILLLQLTSVFASAQPGQALLLFEKHAQRTGKKADSTASLNRMINNVLTVNYLAPLAYEYSNKQPLINQSAKDRYYDHLSQTFSFTGDYRTVLACLRQGNHLVDTGTLTSIKQKIKKYKGAYLVNAKKMILQQAASRKVVMINEAHCKPLHRAFTYSLLAELFKEGYRYLAMETLNNQLPESLSSLSANTGYYTCEPIGGELIRKALRLGFKLVPYEDTLLTGNPRQRDSAQAMHLFEIIQRDPAAKILVHGGYGHIEKMKINEDFVPMAYQFKNMSGIDPFCIDQTFLTEEGNDGYSGTFYDILEKSYPAKEVSVLMKNNEPVRYSPDEDPYDLEIIHPRTTYQAGRATWYSLAADRKKHLIPNCPGNTFLVQAFYLNEWLANQEETIIPADQTYLKTGNNSYTLYLRKGRYKTVLRDIDYKIIGVRTMDLK